LVSLLTLILFLRFRGSVAHEVFSLFGVCAQMRNAIDRWTAYEFRSARRSTVQHTGGAGAEHVAKRKTG
jgi:hypothetical protein